MAAGGMQPGQLHLGSVAWADLGNCPLAVLQNRLTCLPKGTPTMEGNQVLWVEVYRDGNLGG